MTNKEAIRILKSKMDGSVDTSYEWAEAVRMAIKALEQEQPEIIKCKNCKHDNNCEIQYSAQEGSEFFCGGQKGVMNEDKYF